MNIKLEVTEFDTFSYLKVTAERAAGGSMHVDSASGFGFASFGVFGNPKEFEGMKIVKGPEGEVDIINSYFRGALTARVDGEDIVLHIPVLADGELRVKRQTVKRE